MKYFSISFALLLVLGVMLAFCSAADTEDGEEVADENDLPDCPPPPPPPAGCRPRHPPHHHMRGFRGGPHHGGRRGPPPDATTAEPME